MKNTLGKLGYGLLFCVVLPLVLVGWARAAAPLVPLPVPDAPLAGAVLAAEGLLLMLGAMADLWFRGHGLPMNAFPPARLVTAGFYRLLAHPIYVGATLASAGAALLAGSASGLWLVTPTLTLGWLALTWGFENADLRRRFPARPYAPLLSSVPPATAAPLTVEQQWAAMVLLFGPWLLGYEALIFLGPSARSVSTFLPVEHSWPVWPWTVLPYALCYPLTAGLPFVPATQRELRRLLRAGWVLVGLSLFLQLSLPLTAPPRPFSSAGLWAEWLRFERAHDGPAGALPSFHVGWALLAAHFYGRRWPRFRAAAYAVAAAIAASCLTTGQHSLLDAAAGAVVFAVARRAAAVWHGLRAGCERLANSWSAWQVGPVRVINHSLYAALAMALGAGLLGALLGSWQAVALIVVGGLLGAGAWGQVVEGGRHGLSRPFGYYGSLLGGLAGVALAGWWLPVSHTHLLAACALASPLVQAVGRLRCVVQGCCHGGAAPARVGIRVRHPKSRVVAVFGLADRPIHATPLYSLLANGLVAGLLWHLWLEGAAAPLLVGGYFILSGVARFIEEAYRGEVQTPVVGGLKLYQWLAAASVAAGIAATLLPADPLPVVLQWAPAYAATAALAGLAAGVALGVDFPSSKRRFSRLAA